ncbi:DUF7002 family protein [Mucilaginibacter ginsenosidivorans]|nr:DarT ssDNA thymidine ADP-ribosyltransferase family protein [Mucilaginibacter ginsenosidivorans]
MNIDRFITLRPYLYHLTDRDNLPLILEYGKLLSTKKIIELSGNAAYVHINTARRSTHKKIVIGDRVFSIRDQKPISEKNLVKCLTDGWDCARFYDHLNDRVFMWSKPEYLNNHYKTYEHEGPIILRFNTDSILAANPHVKFCRLNSGATRSSSHHNGAPPPRGIDTFQPAETFDFLPSQVKEVTFENECILTGDIYVSDSPYGIYHILDA